MTAEEWERAAQDLESLRVMVASEPAIGGGWTCGTASLHTTSWVDVVAGTHTRKTSPPRGKDGAALLAWYGVLLGAEARLCRARAVLAMGWTALMEDEARHAEG